MRIKIFCLQCQSDQWVDEDTGRYPEHRIEPYRVTCASSGAMCEPSRLPAYLPLHYCGVFCDGYDGPLSRCAEEKRRGAPDIVSRIGDLA